MDIVNKKTHENVFIKLYLNLIKFVVNEFRVQVSTNMFNFLKTRNFVPTNNNVTVYMYWEHRNKALTGTLTWARNGVSIAPMRANADDDPRPDARIDVGKTWRNKQLI